MGVLLWEDSSLVACLPPGYRDEGAIPANVPSHRAKLKSARVLPAKI